MALDVNAALVNAVLDINKSLIIKSNNIITMLQITGMQFNVKTNVVE